MVPTTAPMGRISRITIVGNEQPNRINVSTTAIRAVTTQKEGDVYNQAAVERDRDAIRGMGYFNGEVGLSAVQNAAGGVDITYTVVENLVITRITFTANTPTGEPSIPSAKLKSLMQTQEGQILNVNTLLADFDRLFKPDTGYASQQGYNIQVSADINLDPINGVLTVPLVEAHIQAIEVRGNKKTKKVVITREFRAHPGDVYNQLKLLKDVQRVYNLGLFDTVGPYDIIPTDVGAVIISVPVVEKRSGQVTVGVGYSSRARLVGRAELAENNFRGMGERVSLMWEVGGITSQSSVDLSYFNPYIDKRHTSLDVSLFNRAVYRFASSTFGGNNNSGNNNSGSVGSANQYVEQRRGGSFGLSRPVSDTTTLGITARTEKVSTNNFETPFADAFIRQVGTVAAFGGRMVNNTRDQDFSPASGGLNLFSFELGLADTATAGNTPSPLAPGSRNFGKLGGDVRRYFSLQGPRKPGKLTEPKRVVAVRLLLGLANEKLPFFEQYFLGGADSLRGFQNDRFWGNKLLLFQSELRIPVGKGDTFQGVLLFDAGDSWGSIYQGQGLAQHRNFTLSSNFGLGIRLSTPIGPIRLDYAIPSGGGGGRTQFSIGPSF